MITTRINFSLFQQGNKYDNQVFTSDYINFIISDNNLINNLTNSHITDWRELV